MNMHKHLGFGAVMVSTLVLAMGLAACGDDSSTSSEPNESVKLETDLADEVLTESSSSVMSSSSVIMSDSEGSSSKGESSSSSAMSSSSVMSDSEESSSSEEEDPSTLYQCDADGQWYIDPEKCPSHSDDISSSSTPASSADAIPDTEPESSSSSSEKNVWQYLNPDIEYGEFTDTRDGQVYRTVTIGEGDKAQTWMAENLNYAYRGVTFDNGYYTSDSTSWCYDDMETNCATYGRLYTWAAAMDSAGIEDPSGAGVGCGNDAFCDVASSAARVRGICPEGWHLPSNAEWNALYEVVGGTKTAGLKLKANTSLWYSNTGTDKHGFSVLPAGDRHYDSNFDYQGSSANFWSSTEFEDDSFNAWYQYFLDDNDNVHQYNDYKDFGFSVRCLKD